MLIEHIVQISYANFRGFPNWSKMHVIKYGLGFYRLISMKFAANTGRVNFNIGEYLIVGDRRTYFVLCRLLFRRKPSLAFF